MIGLVFLAVAVMACGTIQGGLSFLAVRWWDYVSSFFFWGIGYREEGIRLLYVCGSLLAGGITAPYVSRGGRE